MLKLRGLARVREGEHGVSSYGESASQEEVRDAVIIVSLSVCVLEGGWVRERREQNHSFARARARIVCVCVRGLLSASLFPLRKDMGTLLLGIKMTASGAWFGGGVKTVRDVDRPFPPKMLTYRPYDVYPL